MPLVDLIFVLIIIGVALYLINIIPMVIIVALVLWIIQALGVMEPLRQYRIGHW